jgi:hypothetical protein
LNATRDSASFAEQLAPHHIKGRVGKLLTDIRYIIMLCESCHRQAHENLKKSRPEMLSVLQMRYYHSDAE